MEINSLLKHWVEKTPNAVGFVENDKPMTYKDFDSLVNRTATWLHQEGVKKDDRVAIWLVNKIEWLIFYFALSKIGATIVTVNTRYKAHELEYLLAESEATMLILEKSFGRIDFLGIFQDIDSHKLRKLKTLVLLAERSISVEGIDSAQRLVEYSLCALPDEQAIRTEDFSDALNILFTTSGTTSKPKLVMHSQNNIALHASRAAQTYGFCDDGVMLLGALPCSGIFGFVAVLATIAAGKTVVLMDVFDAEEACGLIVEHHITHMFGSDEMYKRILSFAEQDVPFPSARVFGFAAFHPGMESFGSKAWQRKVPLIGLYGSSEVQALFALQSTELPLTEVLSGGGIPCNTEATIRIRDPESQELLPLGQSGLIEIRSDTNFLGYLNNQEATEKAVDQEGYFCTNDIGYLTKDNRFVYQARCGDTIRLGGYLVNPAEIEDLLNEQEEVKDSQVVSVDVNSQNRCVAFVILKEGYVLDEKCLLNRLASVTAQYKVPAYVWEIDSFPLAMSSNGAKIKKAELRTLAALKLKENQ